MIKRLLSRVAGDSLERRLARGAGLAFAINVLSIFLGLIAQLVLARSLGIEGYGTFVYVIAWVNLLVVPSLFGFGASQLRYVASYHELQEWSLMQGVRRFAERVVITAGLVCCGAAMLLVWLLGARLDPVLANTFYVGFLIVPVIALMQARAATVRALGEVVAALAPDRLVRQGVLLLGVGGLAILFPGELGPVSGAFVALLAACIALLMVSWSQARTWPSQARTVEPQTERREWLFTALPLLLYGTVTALNTQSSLLLLGWLGTTTDTGIFAVANRLSNAVGFPIPLVTFVLAPSVARLYARNERARLQRIAVTATCWVSGAAVVVASPLLLFPEFFLGLFGEGFAAGATVLRLLALKMIVMAFAGPLGPLMNMTGLERQSSSLMVVMAMLAIALNFLLIPSFGMTGAAVASLIATVFWTIAASLVLWYRRGLLPTALRSVRS